MGYCDNPTYVRVDFFRNKGKWYATESVQWLSYDKSLIHDAFKEALRNHFKDTPDRLSGMTAVCLEPYHQHSHPIMVKEWVET